MPKYLDPHTSTIHDLRPDNGGMLDTITGPDGEITVVSYSPDACREIGYRLLLAADPSMLRDPFTAPVPLRRGPADVLAFRPKLVPGRAR